MTLHQAACEACASRGAPHLGPLLATASLDTADFDRLPVAIAPTPGRCAITLLPLQRIPSAPITTWQDDSQECLVSCCALVLGVRQAGLRIQPHPP